MVNMTYEKKIPKNLQNWFYTISPPYKIKKKERFKKSQNEKSTLCVVTVHWLQ